MTTVHASIADELVRRGTEVVFGLVGAGTDRLTCELVETHGARYISTRHEHGAVAMADGYSRVTGRVGVALISADAGVTNAATALTTAKLAGTRVLVIVGDEAAIAKSNQKRLDQVPLQAALGITTIPVTPATGRASVQRAFRQLSLHRGPVMLNLPWDISAADDVGGPPSPDLEAHGHLSGQNPSDRTIEEVFGLVALAKRPLVLAGSGAMSASARHVIGTFARRIGALTATTLLARGLWKDDPFCVGVCGSFSTDEVTALLATADLVVAFGCSLNNHTRGHGALFADARVVHVDCDPAAIGKWGRFDVGIVGDAEVVANALVGASSTLTGAGLEAFGRDPDGWRTPDTSRQLAGFNPWSCHVDSRPQPGFAEPRAVMKALDELLPPARLVAIDIGYFMSYPSVYLNAGPAPAMVCPWEYGAIGCALGPAIGAAVGRPELYPVLVMGDGGLAATSNELDTVIRCGLPMLVVVMDDGGFRAERELFRQRGVSPTTADVPSPDFAAVAGALGFRAHTARSEADVRSALAGLDVSGATFLRVMLDPAQPNPEMVKAMQGL